MVTIVNTKLIMTHDTKKTKTELIAELEAMRASTAFASMADTDSLHDDKFKQMVDGLPQMVFELNREGQLTYANTFAISTFGFDRSDIENGLSIKQIIHSDDIQRALLNVNRVIKGEGPYGEEYLGVKKDGSTVPIKIFSRNIFKDGVPVGIQGTVLDISEIKRAEEALRTSETYYRTLFENTGTAMCMFSNSSIIRNCNSQFEFLSGYSRKEIEGKMKWSDFVVPDDLKRIAQYHAERTHKGLKAPSDYEFSFLARGDIQKQIHLFIQVIPETDDRVCSLIDITTRKATEKALSESEERYGLVVRGANDGIWDWDLVTDSVYFSPRYKEILGYKDHEFPNIAASWKDRIHPDDLDHTMAMNQKCIKGEVDQFEVEYRMHHKNHSYRWVLGRGASVKDKDGKVYRLAGTHTDITARKLHERTTNALYAISKAINTTRDMQELYESIHTILDKMIDASNFYIALLDEEKDSISFPYFKDDKDSYYDIRNVSSPETRSLTVHVLRSNKPLFLSASIPVSTELQKNIGVVGTPAAVWLGVPLRLKDKVIGVMTVQHYTNPLHYTDSDVTLMEAVSEQVALAIERKANEKELTSLNEELESKVELRTLELQEKAYELEDANKRLTELDEIKSTLVSSVSHELRTPLTSIRGFAKLTGKDFHRYFHPLADTPTLDKKGKRIAQNLDIIRSEGERLTRLINDFLDINRIESGKATWNDTFLNPCEVIRNAVSAVSGAYAAKPDIEILAELPNTVAPIHADPDKIQQVLINLLNNACKFTPKGAVSVSIAMTTDILTVTVTDTGMGIAKKEQAQIFEKFHKSRTGDTISIKDKGTGLGLAICREIVEHYGGEIWVESKLNQGSTFAFSLPTVPGTETACS